VKTLRKVARPVLFLVACFVSGWFVVDVIDRYRHPEVTLDADAPRWQRAVGGGDVVAESDHGGDVPSADERDIRAAVRSIDARLGFDALVYDRPEDQPTEVARAEHVGNCVVVVMADDTSVGDGCPEEGGAETFHYSRGYTWHGGTDVFVTYCAEMEPRRRARSIKHALGHALGLDDERLLSGRVADRAHSMMNPLQEAGSFDRYELDDADRDKLRELYGPR